jgi:hypothetical protein
MGIIYPFQQMLINEACDIFSGFKTSDQDQGQGNLKLMAHRKADFNPLDYPPSAMNDSLICM